jgi:ribosomal protein S18 acetylase RimI-like enzyme
MIARLDLGTIQGLHEALRCFAHVPLAHLHHLSSEQRQDYWIDEISQSLAKESSIGFQSVVSGQTNGFIVYNDSAWDSKLMGRRVGTVEHFAARGDGPQATAILHELIEKLTQALADRGTQCVVCKVQPNERATIHVLEQSGFLLMDTLLDFVFDFSHASIAAIAAGQQDEALKIRPAKADDLPASMAISEKVFAHYFGRFHADPQMPAGTPTKVYAEWVRSAFAGWADWILVAEIDGKVAGYGIWRKPLAIEKRHSLRVAHYDLAAVDPQFQGGGLWAALMLDGMRIARDFAQYVIGPVHISNHPVQHILQKCGWNIAGARHSFHKWFRA